ncbi:hypothetical protein AB210_3070 [Acinetobacter baumannii AB210]|nr:hypothetical protein AB210_3070 [Acinetobacter baumannii AB210]
MLCGAKLLVRHNVSLKALLGLTLAGLLQSPASASN